MIKRQRGNKMTDNKIAKNDDMMKFMIVLRTYTWPTVCVDE